MMMAIEKMGLRKWKMVNEMKTLTRNRGNWKNCRGRNDATPTNARG